MQLRINKLNLSILRFFKQEFSVYFVVVCSAILLPQNRFQFLVDDLYSSLFKPRPRPLIPLFIHSFIHSSTPRDHTFWDHDFWMHSPPIQLVFISRLSPTPWRDQSFF